MRRWLVAALSAGLALSGASTAHAGSAGTAGARSPQTPQTRRAAAIATATTATTAATCPVPELSQPLLRYYDTGWYYLVPNGSLTQGLDSWRTVGPVSVSSQSAPQDVMGAGGGSLAIGWGGRATTQPLCTDSNHDRTRFFYRGTGWPGSSLLVRVTSRSSLWYSSSYTATYLLDASSTSWRLSPTVVVPDWTDASGTQTTTISFESSGGTVLVDDVLVDPWRYNTN
ncbi:hypothetical protein [Arsenicicoccus sp. oral taxon 190]|uniref:hypothetical protein n=1 Tax=Arsenicicoccus sp. oral taxon 190 TaxID=1658671 RepID=UPI00067A17E8|nr:hypothetical protein [Arsenicicoccus sp. oral taxon 190]AKT51145.1 hypothetical protein ADJ73_07135 [Arsenicicoccus sp. oral taxon 190]